MTRQIVPLLSLVAALALSACAHHADHELGFRDRHGKEAPQWQPGVQMLLRYDFNHDGSIGRAELEQGLHQDFDKADTNHDGVLEEDEVRAVNQARWAADGSAASPLIDWNHDGVVDFGEFAAGPRSLFMQLDANGDGALSPQELHVPPSKKAPAERRSSGRHGRRGAGPYGGQGGDGPGGDGPDGDND
ncbi:MAG: hypothetical protein KGR48_09575 [Alphaproteobacteria bacterium]|nr:hypothetical protein [Alphaproteobacteria bacterium]